MPQLSLYLDPKALLTSPNHHPWRFLQAPCSLATSRAELRLPPLTANSSTLPSTFLTTTSRITVSQTKTALNLPASRIPRMSSKDRTLNSVLPTPTENEASHRSLHSPLPRPSTLPPGPLSLQTPHSRRFPAWEQKILPKAPMKLPHSFLGARKVRASHRRGLGRTAGSRPYRTSLGTGRSRLLFCTDEFPISPAAAHSPPPASQGHPPLPHALGRSQKPGFPLELRLPVRSPLRPAGPHPPPGPPPRQLFPRFLAPRQAGTALRASGLGSRRGRRSRATLTPQPARRLRGLRLSYPLSTTAVAAARPPA